MSPYLIFVTKFLPYLAATFACACSVFAATYKWIILPKLKAHFGEDNSRSYDAHRRRRAFERPCALCIACFVLGCGVNFGLALTSAPFLHLFLVGVVATIGVALSIRSAAHRYCE